ncbi:vitamin K epoxide reductase family protein [bacterium]|nr:vitamin K epoxide reductase family protein [bacterium]MCB2179290.1 vitamin K epoxide reductase family protein [bacterium]
MKMKKAFLVFSLLLILLSFSIMGASAQETPIVHALLFYSPYCAHCEYVITEVLPPLFDQYGEQLSILGVDVSQEAGSALFTATIDALEFPANQAGVPFMVIGDTILIGSDQIPQQLPGMIAGGVANSGIAWPDVAPIQEFLLASGFIDAQGLDTTPTPSPELPTEEAAAAADTVEPTAEEVLPTATTPPAAEDSGNASDITVLNENSTGKLTFEDNFNRDRIANSLAIVVLVIMAIAVIWIAIQFMQVNTPKIWPSWILPVLLVIGMGIAIYLATVEVSGSEAICGPVGDCNAVQQSEYATLFGFLPVAIFGIIGYVMIGASWLTARLTSGKTQFFATMAMFLFGLFGLIFFIYLTFLEPFVIGATCAWCLSSAIIMTLINLHNTPLALQAWAEMDVDEYLNDEDDEE